MEFNNNPEIALFVSCISSSRIHFPVLRPEREVEEGADALLVAREEDAFPPAFVAAALFPKSKLKHVFRISFMSMKNLKRMEKSRLFTHSLVANG